MIIALTITLLAFWAVFAIGFCIWSWIEEKING